MEIEFVGNTHQLYSVGNTHQLQSVGNTHQLRSMGNTHQLQFVGNVDKFVRDSSCIKMFILIEFYETFKISNISNNQASFNTPNKK